ncbi:MAG: CoA transferase, partial [Brevundimonas sp.]|nr:CoA transferase [Brevundimonas sp.]
GIPLVDIFAGQNAVIGVLAALRHRDLTGQGQMVDISLFESQLAAMLNGASAWLNAGVVLGRTGNDHPSAAPYGVYEVADGHIIIATFNDREFLRLADVLSHPEWKTDVRFSTNGARVENRPLIKALVAEAVIGKTRDHWVHTLNAAKVSCGPINAMPDIETDPHVLARDMIVEMDHPEGHKVRMTGSPFRLSETPVTYRTAPPLMGEHTDAVLRDVLQTSDDDLERLRASGCI